MKIREEFFIITSFRLQSTCLVHGLRFYLHPQTNSLILMCQNPFRTISFLSCTISYQSMHWKINLQMKLNRSKFTYQTLRLCKTIIDTANWKAFKFKLASVYVLTVTYIVRYKHTRKLYNFLLWKESMDLNENVNEIKYQNLQQLLLRTEHLSAMRIF